MFRTFSHLYPSPRLLGFSPAKEETRTEVNRHAQGRAAVHKDTRSYTSLCTYRHAHTHIQTHTRVPYTHAGTHIHKHTCAYIHLHTDTRIHKGTDRQACPHVLAGMPAHRVYTHTDMPLHRTQALRHTLAQRDSRIRECTDTRRRARALPVF